MPHNKQKFWLRFPGATSSQAVMCSLARATPHTFEFDMRTATVKNRVGLMSVEFSGSPEEIIQAIHFLENLGIEVQTIDGDIVVG